MTYEYKIFSTTPLKDVSPTESDAALVVYLNKKGEQGWKLVAVYDNKFFLEREKISILHESRSQSDDRPAKVLLS